ncbi:MAG: anti-sigma factor family protein [Caldimonas sp.]
MDDHRPGSPKGGVAGEVPPIAEADLHAYADGQLSPARRAEVEHYVAARDEERLRVEDWQRQSEGLRALLNPVLDEPLPLRLPLAPESRRWPWRGLAAAVAMCIVSAGVAWTARGAYDAPSRRVAGALPDSAAPGVELAGFARRAAIAHVVYSPDARRPVEVGGDQEQALVTWLTKRMGSPVRAPALGGLGYELIGGRLLPGETGPVAQFMYGAPGKPRLTLYVTREAVGQDASFRFGRNGAVNVFYWVEGRFGYAISAESDRAELMKVSQEVYRQLKPA